MKYYLSFVALLLIPVFAQRITSNAEDIQPGEFYGCYDVTRWGWRVFHQGPSHCFVSESAAKSLAPYQKKPLKIDVSKLADRYDSDMTALIDEIAAITEEGLHVGLSLTATLRSSEVEQGKNIVLDLAVENVSKEPITMCPETFCVVLVTNSIVRNKKIVWEDSQGRGYWYYEAVWKSKYDDPSAMAIFCHQRSIGWYSFALAEHGEHIRLKSNEGPGRRDVVFEPGGRYKAEFAIGEELIPGEYEVFFCIPAGSLSDEASPRSDRLPFDVVASKSK